MGGSEGRESRKEVLEGFFLFKRVLKCSAHRERIPSRSLMSNPSAVLYMAERTSDWPKYTLQSFIESPGVVIVGMFLDFMCLCHPPAIAHLAQMALDLGMNPDPSLVMSSGFGLLKVGLVGRVFLMQYDVDFLPSGIKPILMSLVHDAKGVFRCGQNRVRNRLPFSSKFWPI